MRQNGPQKNQCLRKSDACESDTTEPETRLGNRYSRHRLPPKMSEKARDSLRILPSQKAMHVTATLSNLPQDLATDTEDSDCRQNCLKRRETPYEFSRFKKHDA